MVALNGSETKGKGEVGPYLYVFAHKKQASLKNDQYLNHDFYDQSGQLDQSKSLKQPCLSFRFSGELSHFEQLESRSWKN